MSEPAGGSEVEIVREFHQRYSAVKEQLAQIIVGMDDTIDQLLIAMLCGGHCILEGVPGLAKTLLISSVGKMLGLSFRRIQFTPDLMPADITGSEVLEEDHTTGKRAFRFIKGPLFANIILADEINRTPPKTQAALLEAMQEHQVSIGGQPYALPHPFFVLATQNPIEQEGTYPLPEAQLDRFMMKVNVGYPSEAEEIAIAKRATSDYSFEAKPILDGDTIERMQKVVRKVPVADHVYAAAVKLVRSSRPRETEHDDFVAKMVTWGAGPRGSISLLLAAKARAILHGRYHAIGEDLAAVALPVLRHRVLLTFNAEAAGQTSDDVVRQLLHPQTEYPKLPRPARVRLR